MVCGASRFHFNCRQSDEGWPFSGRLLLQPEGLSALRLTGLNAPRVAFLDDVCDQQMCIGRPRIKCVMWLGAFAEGLTNSIRALDAVLVVKVHNALLHSDEKKSGMAVPTGASTWPDDEILKINFRLALVLQADGPIATDSDVLVQRNDRGALSQ